jgi:hypothetical protein
MPFCSPDNPELNLGTLLELNRLIEQLEALPPQELVGEQLAPRDHDPRAAPAAAPRTSSPSTAHPSHFGGIVVI